MAKILNDPAAHAGADVVQNHHHNGDGDHHDAGAGVQNLVNIALQNKANAPATHKANDGGHAHIDVPAVENVGDVMGRYLRHHGVHNPLELAGTGGGNRLNRPFVNVFYFFILVF